MRSTKANRSMELQICSHLYRFNAFLKADFSRWTSTDDLKLLELVKKFGSKRWREVFY
jgi:hypothetical protein